MGGVTLIWNVPQILGQRVYSCNSGLSAEGTPQIQVEPTKIPPVTLWLSFLTVLKAKIPFRTERRRTPVLQDEQLAQGQERIRGYVCEAVCRMHLALSGYKEYFCVRRRRGARAWADTGEGGQHFGQRRPSADAVGVDSDTSQLQDRPTHQDGGAAQSIAQLDLT